jgi:hypothetical protein
MSRTAADVLNFRPSAKSVGDEERIAQLEREVRILRQDNQLMRQEFAASRRQEAPDPLLSPVWTWLRKTALIVTILFVPVGTGFAVLQSDMFAGIGGREAGVASVLPRDPRAPSGLPKVERRTPKAEYRWPDAMPGGRDVSAPRMSDLAFAAPKIEAPNVVVPRATRADLYAQRRQILLACRDDPACVRR